MPETLAAMDENVIVASNQKLLSSRAEPLKCEAIVAMHRVP